LVEKQNGIRPQSNPDCENQVSDLVAAAAITAIATATTTTAAEITARTTTATATAAPTAGTFFPRTGDIYRQGATIEIFAVQSFDRLLRFLGTAHGDEGETAGAARHAIHHDVGLHHGAAGGKRVLEIVFSGFEGKISHKQLCAHVMLLSETNSAIPHCSRPPGFKSSLNQSSLEDLPCRGSDKLSNRLWDCGKSSGKFKC
jgi:hypothetical protein